MEAVEELGQELKGGIVNLKSFEKVSVLGKGGFGEVWKAVHKPTKIVCALKMLFMEDGDEELAEMYVREVKILAKCKQSPFLLRLIGFSVTKPFFIVTPFIEGGSLYDYVKKSSKKDLLPTNKTLIAIGVAFGLMQLHKMKLIHRDLKSPNILLDERLLPYICDFGIARKNAAKMTRDVGTTYWMAPEQMDSHAYNEKVDIYSFACVLYEMICHRTPFEGESSYRVAMNVMGGKRDKLPKRDKTICKLIEICWDQDPDRRPSAKEVLEMFIKQQVYFDGTDKNGVGALISLIIQEDESFKPTFMKWINEKTKDPFKKYKDRLRSSKSKEAAEEEDDAEEEKHHHHHHHHSHHQK